MEDVILENSQLNQCNASKNVEHTMDSIPWQDVEPMIVSKEELLEIFGSSSDEETEFYGFSENELGLKEFRSVMSPNKLKFQDDFYMPLFLSHRKRKSYSDIKLSKHGEQIQQVNKSSNLKNIEKTSMQVNSYLARVSCDGQVVGQEISKTEYENPYAKQYNSYRKDRTKSLPITTRKIGKSIKSYKKIKDRNASEKELYSDVSGKGIHPSSEKQHDLKMKIHFESHARPKRKVIVQERDDYVYGITLPSKRRSYLVSPKVITNAKVLKNSQNMGNEELIPEETMMGDQFFDNLQSQEKSMQNLFSVDSSHGLCQEIQGTVEQSVNAAIDVQKEANNVKRKRKNRFKNFRGVETKYCKATFDGFFDSTNEENKTGGSVADNDAKSLSTESVGPFSVKNEMIDLNIKANDIGKSAKNDETTVKVGTDHVITDNPVNIYKESLIDEEARNKLIKDKLWKEARSNAERAEHIKEGQSSNANVANNEGILPVEENTEAYKTPARKLRHGKILSSPPKPKDINLTDSWFIATSKKRKRFGKTDKSSLKDFIDQRDISRDNRKSTPSMPKVNGEGDYRKSKEPFTESIVTADMSRSFAMTRRRRLKNATFEEVSIDTAINVNDEVDRELPTRMQLCAMDHSKPRQGKSCSQLYDSEKGEMKLYNPSFYLSDEALKASTIPGICTKFSKGHCIKTSSNEDYSNATEFEDQNFGLASEVSTEQQKRRNHNQGDKGKECGNHLKIIQSKHDKGDEMCCSNDLENETKKYVRGAIDNIDKTCVKGGAKANYSAVESKVTSSTPTEMIADIEKIESIHLQDQGRSEVVLKGSGNKDIDNHLYDGATKEDKDKVEEKIIDLTQLSQKVNRRVSKTESNDLRNIKSDKRLIVKSQLGNIDIVKSKNQIPEQSSKSFYDGRSDTEFDITAVEKDEEQENGDTLKESKVKRKIFTVVRKIRRTEINADGKKVTKIIKQIVKKVCPVLKDTPSIGVNRGRVSKVQKIDNEEISTKTGCNQAVKIDKVKAKASSFRSCGKCKGCLREEDCKSCEACRKKDVALPGKVRLICRMRRCNEKGNRKRKNEGQVKKRKNDGQEEEEAMQIRKAKPAVPLREQLSMKSLTKLKKGDMSTVVKENCKPKARSKCSKSGLKDVNLHDDVYAPGFRLRSKILEVVRARPNRILKQVKYSGMEPKVKLPWPEEQDEQSVCNSGSFFCVTSPIEIAAKDLCFHCGSGGLSKMITCINCSEKYHEFCIDIDPLDEGLWLCDRCKRCNVCGYKDNLLMCDKCHDCYHAECLGPFYQKETEGVDECWVCAKCVKCEKCGAKVPGKKKESKWMNDFTLCEECSQRIERGQYCLICRNIYLEDDYDTKMMYCSSCCKWIHMECEGLNNDEYECLADLPEEIPYVCKLCHGSYVWPTWYQEVREEIQAGFEKVYYELIASSDMKIVKGHLPEFQCFETERVLQDTFKRVQDHGFTTIEEFYGSLKKFIESLAKMIDGLLPEQIISDLHLLLKKQIQAMFPWSEGLFNKPKVVMEVPQEYVSNKPDVLPHILSAVNMDHSYNKVGSKTVTKTSNEVDVNQTTNVHGNCDVNETNKVTVGSEIKNPGNEKENIVDKLICHERSFSAVHEQDKSCGFNASKALEQLEIDQNDADIVDIVYSSKDSMYDDETSQNGAGTCMEGKMRAAKHIDDRRCLLCSQYGDEDEQDSGRILNAGLNEWVHVNCALWSAEVYENDVGLLQNVHVAISRGQKLQCSSCQQWGATVGCCTSSCPSNYHFMCARNAAVIFQNDKLVFCPKHKARSKSEVILNDDGFVVARPVMVDLSKVSNQKKFAADRDPDSINIFSGSLVIHHLGRLTESSSGEEVLFPVGFRATRLFWSSTDTSKRCKYFCSIDEVPAATKTSKEKEVIFMGGVTVAHSSKSVKRNRISEEESLEAGRKRPRLCYEASCSAEKPMITPMMETLNPTSNPTSSCSHSIRFSKKPLANSRGVCDPSSNSLEKSATNSSITAIINSSCESVTAVAKCKQTANVYHKTSPHKIIPQPGSHCPVFEKSAKKPNCKPVKLRLIQPKLRYEAVPRVLQPDVSCSLKKRPILPKCDPPVVAIARHLQYHLTSNPQVLHDIGDATLQGLNQVLGVTYSNSLLSSPFKLNVNSDRTVRPCYALNLPDAFWSLHAVEPPLHQTHQREGGQFFLNTRANTDSCSQTDTEVGNNDREVKEQAETESQICACDKKNLSDCRKEMGIDIFNETEEKSNQASPSSFLVKQCSAEKAHIDVNSVTDVSVHKLGSEEHILPTIREFVEKIVATSQPHNGKAGDEMQCRSSNEMSPISLENISDLSCLQAAAQLAKLMPEIFKEGEKSSNLAQNSSERGSPCLKDSNLSNFSSSSISSNSFSDGKCENKRKRKWYHERMKRLLSNEKKSESRLRVTIRNEDGLIITGSSVQDVWKQMIEGLNETRIDQKLPLMLFNENEAFDFFGIAKFPTLYLAEQLPGGHRCRNYKFQYHLPCVADEDKDLPLNVHGCARAEIYTRQGSSDMFAWLASPYRTLAQCADEGESDNETSKIATDLPLSMRFRQLKNKVKDHVGVYRSMIDGRGLFCKRQIEASEMVIEYAGSVIRATLTDKRENYYEGKGYGCYMFRIDDTFVVDATLFGNEARFINHSCEPNCYSRIVSVDGEKHIVIFAARRIYPGEELTYDYKFPFEEEKLPCHCGSKKCRKYLN